MLEEKMKILKMIEEKKITAEEGANLLKAIDEKEREEAFTTKGKKIKIVVYEEGNMTKPTVNINIPIALVKFFGKFLPEKAKVKLQEKDISFEEIMSLVESGQLGKIVEVDDGKERVEISVE
jgi:hypothetical protein